MNLENRVRYLMLHTPAFPEAQKAAEETWLRKLPVGDDYYYLVGRCAQKTPHTLVVNEIEETFENILKKTICGFESLLKDPTWWYLLRTNNGTYIEPQAVHDLIKVLPKRQLLAGFYKPWSGPHYERRYRIYDYKTQRVREGGKQNGLISGWCMLFSRDVIQRIVTYARHHWLQVRGADDVWLSQKAQDVLGIRPICLGRQDYIKPMDVYRMIPHRIAYRLSFPYGKDKKERLSKFYKLHEVLTWDASPTFTICIPYYENPLALEHHLRIVSSYASHVLPHVEVIIVDDGSPEHPAAPVMEKLKPLPMAVRLFRMEKDIPWNQPGCNNIAFHMARGNWLIHMDVEHMLPPEDFLRLFQTPLQLHTTYKFARHMAIFHPQGHMVLQQSLRSPPNIYCTHKQSLLAIRGYNEKYAGHYGDDFEFLPRLAAVTNTVLLSDIRCVVDKGVKGYARLSRDVSINRERYRKNPDDPDIWNFKTPFTEICV